MKEGQVAEKKFNYSEGRRISKEIIETDFGNKPALGNRIAMF
jgi:hypothetical protein